MGEDLKGRRVVRSGLALTLVGTLMVPTTAAFAANSDDSAQPSTANAVEQAMQQAAADADGQGNVTIIVQLEDGAGARGSIARASLGSSVVSETPTKICPRDAIAPIRSRSRSTVCPRVTRLTGWFQSCSTCRQPRMMRNRASAG